MIIKFATTFRCGEMLLLKRIMPKFLLLLVLLLPLKVFGQENFWRVLAEVSFKPITDKNGLGVEKPFFSDHLKSFHGKKVKLKGYIVPLNEVDGAATLMLSSLPFNTCYFCGGAGPETVLEIETTQPIKFSTKAIIIEGILMLNDSDPDHHIYILKSASLTLKL
jgi:hypothetical protein